jgi:predicted KAP-like P-loop ATPase
LLTYPAVKDEVNTVDFIAMESLRVFCPTIYNIIYENHHIFVEELNASIEELKKSYYQSFYLKTVDSA